MSGIRITLYLLLIMHILPIAITQLLIMKYPFERQKNGVVIKLICTAANLFFNGLVIYEIIMYSKFSLDDIIDYLNCTCSYQDISRLATTNIVSLSLSVLIGFGIFTWAGWYCKSEHFFHFSGKCALLIVLAAIPIILGYRYGNSGSSYLEISEICRKTSVANAGGYSWSQDVLDDGLCYVSITNNGVLTYELDPLYLSADINELQTEQRFQGITIVPGETYQFFMFGRHSLDIKKAGGSIIYLSDKFGNIIDTVEVPALDNDQSYKNTAAGWQVISLAEEVITVTVPSFSEESGFYDGAFELELTAAPGTTVYYTTDSSNPTVKSTKYSGPIHVYDRSEDDNQYPAYSGETPVDKCFVVRAVAVDGDGNYSDIVTKSYFVNMDDFKDRTVISLVSDPDGLFGDNGIYVNGKAYDEWYQNALANAGEDGKIDHTGEPTRNYNKRGIAWERKSNLEVFENSDLLLGQPVGIRIQGGSARGYVKKRFSIYARKEYGLSAYFDASVTGDYRQHSLYTREGDLHAISQMIGRDRDVATTNFVPVDLFLNGEFWCTTYLHEKFNEKDFAQKYNLLDDNVIIAKHGQSSTATDIGNIPLSSVAAFITGNDMSLDENYYKFDEILDIQSYIDWACINTFLQNMDYWERANSLFWHTAARENRQEGDSRWRLGLYDMDLNWNVLKSQYGGVPANEANPFTMIADWDPGPITEWPIYSALRKNDIFCKQYVLTFMDLINTNFSVENTAAIMEELRIENESYKLFFETRAEHVIPYMAEEFELTGTQEKVTLSSNISGAPITLNTISPELRASDGIYSWTGDYFTDYPVTVTADAPNFSHWEVTANGSVLRLTDNTIEVPVSTGGVEIHAVFE